MKSNRLMSAGSARPGEAADTGQEGLADVEHLEAGGDQGRTEVGLAEIPPLDVPQRLEDRGGQEPAQRAERFEQPALRSHRAQRGHQPRGPPVRDRKSTRLNSSHGYISYAVFCL